MSWRPYLDIQVVQHQRHPERGIPRYAAEFSRALLAAGVPVAAFALNPHLPPPKYLPRGLAAAPQLRWNTARALREAIESGPTLYHLLGPFEAGEPVRPWLPLNLVPPDVPFVATVYDLIPEVQGIPGRREERWHRIRGRLLKRADLLLALSEQTRHDVVEQLGVADDRVVVIGAGGSEFFELPTDADESPTDILREHLPMIERPFLFTLSAWEPRKNTEVLIDAFAGIRAELRRNLQLVIACSLPPEGHEQWRTRARHHGLRASDVVFTGFVSDLVLRALYQQTELFVYPSRYEGFGLPVVEAARCGASAVVADAPGLREVVGWEPATFDPDDADHLAALIELGVADSSFRARLRDVAGETARRHTWQRVAERTVAAYARLDLPTRRRSRGLPRLALVGPFPPVRTGIAQYNAEIAAHLAERSDLDCFVDACDWAPDDVAHEAPTGPVQAVGAQRPIDSRARWFPARALGLRIDPARYDAVLYAIGNSWFHHDTLALARRFPGIAWLHDVELPGLYITYARRLLSQPHRMPEAVTLFRDVLQRYGERAPGLPITEDDGGWATYEPYRRTGVRFTLELARDAAGCIVASKRARDMLEFDAGPAALLPPVHVLPLAVPERDRRGNHELDPPCIVTLGRQDLDAKQPETVVEATALVARARPVRLALVGAIRPELHAQLVRRAEQLAIADSFEITGYVDDDEYRRRLDEASCAIQLRRSSANGEGSAAVNDALAVGLPVVTNIMSCRELPAGTVQLVPPDAPPRDLASEIERVLDDDAHRRRLSDAGFAHSRTWTFDDLTTRLLEIIDATKGQRWQRQRKSA